MYPFFRAYLFTCWMALLLTNTPVSAQDLTTDQWREDLTFLVETLKSVHPNPFHRVPEPEFDTVWKTLDRDLPTLSTPEIVVGMTKLTAFMQDGHTSLRLQNGLKLDQWYPVRLERFEEGIFVIAADRSQADLLGVRVLQMAGKPAMDVWEAMQDISPGDNIFSRMARVPYYLAIPEIFKGLGLSDGGRLPLVIQTRSGESKAVLLDPIKIEAGFGQFFSGTAPGTDVVTWSDGMGADKDLYFQHNTDRYWYHLDTSTGLLYAQINAVLDTQDPVFLNGEQRALSLTAFSVEILKQVDEGRVQTLIIDLRNNGGGNNFLARPLVDGLVARPAINQKGRLFVLTGRQTYSAAMNLTSMLEGRTRALFVGEPPGGTPLHYGDATNFTLPHSGMSLNVSTLHWDLGVEPTDVREVMEPQISVPPRFADLKTGRDPALDAIRQYKQSDLLADHMLDVYQAENMDAALNLFLRDKQATSPWSSQAQQLIAFGYKVIGADGSGEDIYRAFRFATEQYLAAPEAWFHLGRVYAFPGRWKEAAEAYQAAYALRPTNDLIRRMYQAAKRK